MTGAPGCNIHIYASYALSGDLKMKNVRTVNKKLNFITKPKLVECLCDVCTTLPTHLPIQVPNPHACMADLRRGG